MPPFLRGPGAPACLAGCLAVQACLFALPGPYWDGWIYHVLFVRGQFEEFMAPFRANGRPLGGTVLWWAMQLGGPVAGHKLVSAVSLLGATACLYAALRTRDLCNRAEACTAALVTTTVPAVQVALASSALQFFLGFVAFYAGLLLFMRSAVAQAGPGRTAGYIGALACAAASVALAESPLILLPLYPLAWLVARRGWRRPSGWRDLRDLVLHSAPVAAGVAALVATFVLYPTTGAYEGAHDVRLSPLALLTTAALFPVALVGSEVFLLAALAWAWRGAPPQTVQRHAVAGALAVLALGILPYVVAGRWPAILGWGSRALLLSGLGLGLLSVALLRATPAGRVPRAALVICVAALACTLWRFPLWAARQAKDDVVRLALSADPRARAVQLMWIDDANWVIAAPYRHYEWTAMAQMATGRTDLLALQRATDEAAALAQARASLRDQHGLLPPAWSGAACVADVRVAPLGAAWMASATIRVLQASLGGDVAYQSWLRMHAGAVRVSPRRGCTPEATG